MHPYPLLSNFGDNGFKRFSGFKRFNGAVRREIKKRRGVLIKYMRIRRSCKMGNLLNLQNL